MSFERDSASVPMTSQLASGSTAVVGELPLPLRLQILSTEHWSLLASRSLSWNESFSRAGMFLSTLSGAMVAVALVAQASAFGTVFIVFALVILPIVLFVGVATFLRLGGSNYHDAICVIGMNRIRGAYLELAPDLERYFVMSAHDDFRGVGITMAVPPNTSNLVHLVAATPFLIVVLNSVLVGVISALVMQQFAFVTTVVLLVGVLGFFISLALHATLAHRTITRLQNGVQPLFPTPADLSK